MDKILKDGDGRIYYLDILRICSIALVILLHSLTPYITNAGYFGTKTWWFFLSANAAARMGVPLFLMISGYLLLNSPKTTRVFEFYKKRFVKILLPFLVWDAIYFIIYGLVPGEKNILDFFRELLVGGSMYHFWFVYTLAGIYLLTPFLKRVVDNCSGRELVLFLLIICFTGTIRPLLNTVTPLYIYLFEPLMEGYAGFFVLGYILGKFDIGKTGRFIIYAGGAGGLLLSITGNHLYSSPEQINLYFNGGYQINHFLTAAAFFVFIKRHKFKNKKITPLITSASGAVYGVYLMHALVLSVLQRYSAFGGPVINICVTASAAFIICMLVMLAVSRIRYINKLLL